MKIIVPTLISNNKSTTLFEELPGEMRSHTGSTWTAKIDLRMKDGSVTSEKVDLAFTEALCSPFNVLCNLCMQEKALSASV